jgi:hypothetical protein
MPNLTTAQLIDAHQQVLDELRAELDELREENAHLRTQLAAAQARHPRPLGEDEPITPPPGLLRRVLCWLGRHEPHPLYLMRQNPPCVYCVHGDVTMAKQRIGWFSDHRALSSALKKRGRSRWAR